MKLVVGLGNPGSKYARTRHNFGFMIADALAAAKSAPFSYDVKFEAEVAKAGDLIIAKPQTFMNLSGRSVQKLAHFLKLSPEDIWVVYDDVDVPFGRLRLRIGGASGHQGIRSISQHIGPDFIRVRAGISLNDRAVERSEEYVLHPFTPDERAKLPQTIEAAAGIINSELESTPTETTFEL